MAKKGNIPWNKGVKTGERPFWVRIKISQGKKGKPFCSPGHFKKGNKPIAGFKKGFPSWNKGLPAEMNSNWQGGKSYEIYPLGWNRTFKEQIRRRDGYKCFICSLPEVESLRKLDVHHIDYNKKNILPENLITLCRCCHTKTAYNRDHWKELFRCGLLLRVKV